MKKISGILVLVIGLAVMLSAILNLFPLEGAESSMAPGWPTLRIVMLAVGALAAVMGCYSMVKKAPKQA